MYIYIYIYIEREREGGRKRETNTVRELYNKHNFTIVSWGLKKRKTDRQTDRQTEIVTEEGKMNDKVYLTLHKIKRRSRGILLP